MRKVLVKPRIEARWIKLALSETDAIIRSLHRKSNESHNVWFGRQRKSSTIQRKYTTLWRLAYAYTCAKFNPDPPRSFRHGYRPAIACPWPALRSTTPPSGRHA